MSKTVTFKKKIHHNLARIGLAEEVASRFKVAWVDSENPSKGFRYLYLDHDAHNDLVVNAKTPSVVVEELNDKGETRYMIVDVIGRTHGLGVENLQGSGKIAGETSRAYADIFTLTLVTCRSVGELNLRNVAFFEIKFLA